MIILDKSWKLDYTKRCSSVNFLQTATQKFRKPQKLHFIGVQSQIQINGKNNLQNNSQFRSLIERVKNQDNNGQQVDLANFTNSGFASKELKSLQSRELSNDKSKEKFRFNPKFAIKYFQTSVVNFSKIVPMLNASLQTSDHHNESSINASFGGTNIIRSNALSPTKKYSYRSNMRDDFLEHFQN